MTVAGFRQFRDVWAEVAELRQFHTVWSIDFEFRQIDGERPEVHCMSALNLLTGQRLDLNASQLRYGHCPFDVENSLFIAYGARAEMTCFAALGWPIPKYILDLNIEYIHLLNDGLHHPRKLLNALDYFGLPHIDAEDKKEMQALAIRGDLTPSEMREMQEYCASDTKATGLLFPPLAYHFDFISALVRGRFTGCVGLMEHIGIPVDMELLARLRER